MNYSITDFGAMGDGKTLNTEAIQAAIEACTASGGGRVTVPAGKFLSGTIQLKSNVDLHLESGVDRIPGVIEGVNLDHLYLTCEGALTIAGERESPIRNVTLSDSAFVWKKQGSLYPDCLDEQPSRRGVYPCAVPMVYIRCGEDISLRERVRMSVDASLKGRIRETIVTENA